MGQYYKAVNVDNFEYVSPHSIKTRWKRDDGKVFLFGQGVKLMEHSYLKNRFLGFVSNLLTPDGAWYKASIVWAGDYADQEAGYPKTKEGYGQNLYSIVETEGKSITAGKRTFSVKAYPFLVNWDKKEYVDLRTLKADGYGFTIHPLPLLTAEGNGRGGGDFDGEDARIGRWARDHISIEARIPVGGEYGFTKIDGQFTE